MTVQNSDRRELLRYALAIFSSTLAGCGGGATTPMPAAATGTPVASATPPIPDSPTCKGVAQPPSTGDVPRTSFIHPGLLNTEASFDRIRARVSAGDQPWTAGLAALLADSWSNSAATPRPLQDVTRPGNFAQMFIDMQRTYELALAWKITGETKYATAAVLFLDSWSSVMKTLTGNADAYLAAGLYGYQWASAAEIMRGYSGWSTAGVQRWQSLLKEVFYSLSNNFLVSHNGTENNITNYWASWDLISTAGVMAIGVFCDDLAIYEQGKNYFLSGRGNGAAAHMVYLIHPGLLGQYQESGRDQGHSTLGMACLAAICEIAWNQGDDLYGYWNNRVLSAVEYVAASNLTNADGTDRDLPFDRYVNKQGVFTTIAGTARAARRPCFEAFYNHYVNRRGLAAPYTTLMAAALRPELRDATGDSPGLGTLTYSLPAIAQGVAPSGVVARIAGAAVAIDWWGSAYATAYLLERAQTACGTFSTLATVTGLCTYTDVPATGTWFYRVTAVTPSGSLSSDPVSVVYPGELRFHLPLDVASGVQVVDASSRFGASTLNGGVSWGEGRNGGRAPTFDGSSGYMTLPTGIMSDLADYTVALWVRLTGASAPGAWLFNLSTSDVAYLAIIPRDGALKLRTPVTLTTRFGEQETVSPDELPIGSWVHIALSLSGKTQTLYVNGVVKSTNTRVDIAPHQFGQTDQNWIGRSSYSADPYFNGAIQDLRVYSHALGSTELLELAT